MSYQNDKNRFSKSTKQDIIENYLQICYENKVENQYFSLHASSSYQDKNCLIISRSKYPKGFYKKIESCHAIQLIFENIEKGNRFDESSSLYSTVVQELAKSNFVYDVVA